MATLKQILDAVMGESGFLVPPNYAASSNQSDLQLLYLANAASDELRDLGLVQARRTASLFLTAATSYTLPEDFYSYVSDTAMVGTRPVELPTTADQWAYGTALGNAGARYRVRFLADGVSVLAPQTGDTITYEYVSSYPWTAASVGQEQATADTDVWELDRRLLTMAVKWRWKKEKGMEDWQTDQAMFAAYVNKLRARNAGARTLQFTARDVSAPEPYADTWV